MRKPVPERVLHPVPLPPARQQALSAEVFWKLMDRWKVPTTTALTAIGYCPSEADKAAERPDFRLSDDQAKFLSCLLEIELTLTVAEIGRQRTGKGALPIDRMLLLENVQQCDPTRAAEVLWRLNTSAVTAGARAY